MIRNATNSCDEFISALRYRGHPVRQQLVSSRMKSDIDHRLGFLGSLTLYESFLLAQVGSTFFRCGETFAKS